MSLRVHRSLVRIPFRAEGRDGNARRQSWISTSRGGVAPGFVACSYCASRTRQLCTATSRLRTRRWARSSAALRALELVLGVGQVGAQQLELRPVALVELRRHPRHLPPASGPATAGLRQSWLPVTTCTETVRAASPRFAPGRRRWAADAPDGGRCRTRARSNDTVPSGESTPCCATLPGVAGRPRRFLRGARGSATTAPGPPPADAYPPADGGKRDIRAIRPRACRRHRAGGRRLRRRRGLAGPQHLAAHRARPARTAASRPTSGTPSTTPSSP